jgi:hypothetical protein
VPAPSGRVTKPPTSRPAGTTRLGGGTRLQISRAFVDGEPVGDLTRDAAGASGQPPPPVTVPVAFTTFPDEIWAAPRSWVEAVYPGVAYFNEVDRGGHFAAWEEPDLFTAELRAAFRPLR